MPHQDRLRFLAEASQILASSLDYQVTLDAIARLVVPRFADWCVVDVLRPDGSLEVLAMAHVDPEKVRIGREVRARFPEDPRDEHSLARLARDGRARLIPEITPEMFAARVADPEHRALLARLGPRSALNLPLRARGRSLGVLTLVAAELHPPYGEPDVPFFEELASRCAVAIDNAALLREAEEARARVEALRARAERSADWARRLQAVTAALSEALTPDRIATVVVDQGLAALGGGTGAIWRVDPTGQRLELVRAANYQPAYRERFAVFPLDRRAPLVDAFTSGRPKWVESRAELARDYPHVHALIDPGELAFACIPLVAGGRALGALGFSMQGARPFTLDEREFVQAIAHPCAQALERARLYEALEREREALRDEARRKDEFLAVLSHELRTPLAPMAAALDRMSVRAGDGVVVAECRDLVARQLEHVARLVDDLLDVARIAHGKVQLRTAVVDLRDVVAGALDARRDGRVLLELAGAPVPVEADRVRVEQIVANLVGNAVRHTPPGGRITVSVGTAGDDALVAVRDTGAGIAADDLSRIFEPFFQGTGAAATGLGLGLSLVRQLVALHGGAVAAHSDGLGHGSEFVVRLPRAGSAPAGTDPPPPGATPALSVLVVDDQPAVARSLALLLADLGHAVATAADGEEALAVAAARRPDLVLLDIDLPRLDGYEVARRLRAMPGLEQATLVALSGFAQDSDRTRSREAGMHAHVAKPILPTQLRELLAGAALRTDRSRTT